MLPTKYKPEYCEQLIEHMSRGKSFESFGFKIRVGRTTMYDWADVHCEWKEARAIGQMAALDFFETRMAAKVSGMKFKDEKFNPKDVDTTMCIFAMKTRFHEIYGEKHQHSGEVDTNFNFNIKKYGS